MGTMIPQRIYSNAELESMISNPVQDSLVRALAADLLNTRGRNLQFSKTLRGIAGASKYTLENESE